MKNFLYIRDIPTRDLKKIISDAKNRKSKRKRLNTLDPDKDIPLKGKILFMAEQMQQYMRVVQKK